MNRFTLIALLSAVVVVGCASDKDKKAKEAAAQNPPPELTAPVQPTPIPATPVNSEPAVTAAPAPVVAPAPAPAPKAAAKPVTSAKSAAPAVKPAETSSKTYVVKKGDSLSEIAKAHNTTVKKIMAINPSIKSADKIEVGQKIKLP